MGPGVGLTGPHEIRAQLGPHKYAHDVRRLAGQTCVLRPIRRHPNRSIRAEKPLLEIGERYVPLPVVRSCLTPAIESGNLRGRIPQIRKPEGPLVEKLIADHPVLTVRKIRRLWGSPPTIRPLRWLGHARLRSVAVSASAPRGVGTQHIVQVTHGGRSPTRRVVGGPS